MANRQYKDKTLKPVLTQPREPSEPNLVSDEPSHATQPSETKYDSSTLAIQSETPPDLGPRYDILGLVGTGGMGTVWKVHDKELNEDFAIKVLKPELVTDETALKRFQKEANLASELTHANIAAIFGPGEDGAGRPYIIMRYVDGDSLADILKREGKLSEERAIDIFNQLCEALSHSHMKGIIHRDIKPSNIIISKTESGADLVQLVDFGIARCVYDEVTKTQALTKAVDVFGSPRYMSPEQLLGQEVTGQSDIYSLGIVLYEMLTGEPPFTDENPVKLIMQQLNTSPDLEKISPTMAGLVESCTSKNPLHRARDIGILSKKIEENKILPLLASPSLMPLAGVYAAACTFAAGTFSDSSGVLLLFVGQIPLVMLSLIFSTENRRLATKNKNLLLIESFVVSTIILTIASALLSQLLNHYFQGSSYYPSLPSTIASAILASIALFLGYSQKPYFLLSKFTQNIELRPRTRKLFRTLSGSVASNILVLATSLTLSWDVFRFLFSAALANSFAIHPNIWFPELLPSHLTPFILSILLCVVAQSYSHIFYKKKNNRSDMLLTGIKDFGKALAMTILLFEVLFLGLKPIGMYESIPLKASLYRQITEDNLLSQISNDDYSYFASLEKTRYLRQYHTSRSTSIPSSRKQKELAQKILQSTSSVPPELKLAAHLTLVSPLQDYSKHRENPNSGSNPTEIKIEPTPPKEIDANLDAALKILEAQHAENLSTDKKLGLKTLLALSKDRFYEGPNIELTSVLQYMRYTNNKLLLQRSIALLERSPLDPEYKHSWTTFLKARSREDFNIHDYSE